VMRISIKVKMALMVFLIISAVLIAVSFIIIDQLKKPLENEIEKKAAAITRNLLRSGSEAILTGDELRLSEDVVAYFKVMAEEAGVPYQSLINLYLRDCVAQHRQVQIIWPAKST